MPYHVPFAEAFRDDDQPEPQKVVGFYYRKPGPFYKTRRAMRGKEFSSWISLIGLGVAILALLATVIFGILPYFHR